MNPLTVLEKVFEHLSLEDLKNCRLVNKAWANESTIIVKKLSSAISIGTCSLLTNSIIPLASDQCPLAKFNFASHFFSDTNCSETFANFASAFHSELESLAVTLDKESVVQVEFDFKKFPKLTKLTLSGHGLDLSSCSSGHLPSLFSSLLSSTPRLESLSIIMDSESDLVIRALIDFMAANPYSLNGIRRLELYAKVGDAQLLALTKMPLKLTRLKCDFARSCFLKESLRSFIASQSSSLEYLKFDNYFGNSCYTVAFPEVMPNVKTLVIDGRSELSSKEMNFAPFNYKQQFPSLSKLVLGGSIQNNNCWKLFFPEGHVVQSLMELKLTASFIAPQWVERIGSLFPNLKKLYFVLSPKNEELASAVFEGAFKRLKELGIYFHFSCENVDHLFKGIVNLKHLKCLRLISDEKNQKCAQISENSLESFLQMESLLRLTIPSIPIKTELLNALKDKLELIIIN